MANRLPSKERDPLRVAVAQTGHAIMPIQRIVIEVLLHSLTRTAALERLQEKGFDVDGKTLSRWMRNEGFVNALQARADQLAAQLTKSSVIVNARNILEEALHEQPILNKKGDIVGSKRELSVALNANEQIGKALGAFNKDESGKQVVVLDIDFSGRANVVQEYVDGEIVEAPPRLEGPDATDVLIARATKAAEKVAAVKDARVEAEEAATRAEHLKRAAALEEEIKRAGNAWLE